VRKGQSAEPVAPHLELCAILERLGPIADRLGSRAVIAQYEADINNPGLTRAGTALEGTAGPLPRFLPVRDILQINFNMHALVPAEAVPERMARSARIPIDDNLAAALPYAPTLGAALSLVVRYGEVGVPWYRRATKEDGDRLRITYDPVVPLGRIEPLATEIALATVHRIVEMFVGQMVSSAEVSFARSPVSSPSLLADRFICPVLFGGTESYMAIPADWQDRPSPYHDPALWQEGLARCEADMRLLQDMPLARRVRSHVRSLLDHGKAATLADTARALHTSERSLVRALQQAGQTHHEIVDSERLDRARHLLAQPLLSLSEIADRLAFADQSSFGRKCRAWFGESPSCARRKLIGTSQG
jgi:AraC-like DNA-binding protein